MPKHCLTLDLTLATVIQSHVFLIRQLQPAAAPATSPLMLIATFVLAKSQSNMQLAASGPIADSVAKVNLHLLALQ